MTNDRAKAHDSGHLDKHPEVTQDTLVPPVDICEDTDRVTLFADLPGVGRDDLDVQIDRDTLQIYGRTARQTSPEEKNAYTEFPEKNYYRAFTIGEEIDKDRVEASMCNGVLTLVLPKAERTKPKKINITFS